MHQPIQESSANRLLLRLLLLLIVVGSVFRLSQYFARRSFWHDESSVIVNLWGKSPAQLMGPLDDPTAPPVAAPPVFLLIEKAAGEWFGYNELSLRFYGQILALLALPLFSRIAWQSLPARGAVVAMLLFAACPQLIEHSAEVKPYSGDVFFACLLWWLAVEKRLSAEASAILWRVGTAAAVAMWFSFTTGLVFAGISFALLPDLWRSKKGRAIFVVVNLLVGVSVLLEYFISIRHQRYPILQDAWESMFVDWEHPRGIALWLIQSFGQMAYFAGDLAGTAVMVLAVFGILKQCIGGHRKWAAMFLLPIGLDLAAAAVHVYPFGGSRATLFQIVPMVLLAGVGFAALTTYRWRLARWLGWLAMGAYVIIVGVEDCYCLAVPRSKAHVRPAIEYVQAHRKPGDAIYVIGGETSLNYRVYVRGQIDPLTTINVRSPEAFKARRFWLIFGEEPVYQERRMWPWLIPARAIAQEKDSFRTCGGGAFLFERRDDR